MIVKSLPTLRHGRKVLAIGTSGLAVRPACTPRSRGLASFTITCTSVSLCCAMTLISLPRYVVDTLGRSSSRQQVRLARSETKRREQRRARYFMQT